MAGSNTLSSHAPPPDREVHRGAILFLPRKQRVDNKHGASGHVRTIVSAGGLMPGSEARFRLKTNDAPVAAKAYAHPILVLSRSDAHTIEFITLRSYQNTPLEIKQSDWGLHKGRAIVDHHLSIFPAQHPLLYKADRTATNPTFKTLYLSDGLQMSAKEGCLSVLPVMTMDWRYTERYFRKDKPDDTHSHWQLEEASMNTVLDLARTRAGYTPHDRHHTLAAGT